MNNPFKPINSINNSQIKLLGKLTAKKYRQEFGQFMVENFVIIADALADGFDFEAFFVTEDFVDKHQSEIDFIQKNSQAKNFYLIDEKINKSYSELDTPSGVTAIYNVLPKKITNSSVVYLNGISDPGNLGAIMRNCLAFGFINLILDKTCADVYSSKTINAAKDAIFKLNIFEDKDGGWLEKNTLPVYTTSSHSGRDLQQFAPATDFCLVLGSESHGVSSEISEKSSENIKIEMTDKIESLNVASASAILLYELRKK
ncbi:MAG: RNA methyltransferase [Patescibacteria group bacterium]|jgi:TrmH family RNA methyltransferase